MSKTRNIINDSKLTERYLELLEAYLLAKAGYQAAYDKKDAQDTLIVEIWNYRRKGEAAAKKAGKDQRAKYQSLADSLQWKQELAEAVFDTLADAELERREELKRAAAKLADHLQSIKDAGIEVDETFLYELRHV